MRMKAADTRASRATADCTPLTVVSRSSTTAEIDTFISDVSMTNTNIAIASRTPSRETPLDSDGAEGSVTSVPGMAHRVDADGDREHERLVLARGDLHSV